MSAFRLLPLAALLLPPSVALAQNDPSRLLNPLASVGKGTLGGFVEKPLFEPSRHPPVVAPPVAYVPPPPAPPMAEAPPPLRLIGVVEGARSLAAIVHRNDTGKTETLRPGDHIGTWAVEVMPATLRVVSGDRAFDYAMFRGNLQQGPVAVVPPPVAPTVAAREPGTNGAR